MTNPFVPTARMKACASEVLVAMANLRLIEPIVIAYKRNILASEKWPVLPEYADTAGEFVLDPDHDFLMGERLFQKYAERCRQARNAAGLRTAHPEGCPLSDAKWNLSKKKTELIKSMKGEIPVDVDLILKGSVIHQDEFAELTLKLLIPYLNADKALLN